MPLGGSVTDGDIGQEGPRSSSLTFGVQPTSRLVLVQLRPELQVWELIVGLILRFQAPPQMPSSSAKGISLAASATVPVLGPWQLGIYLSSLGWFSSADDSKPAWSRSLLPAATQHEWVSGLPLLLNSLLPEPFITGVRLSLFNHARTHGHNIVTLKLLAPAFGLLDWASSSRLLALWASLPAGHVHS